MVKIFKYSDYDYKIENLINAVHSWIINSEERV